MALALVRATLSSTFGSRSLYIDHREMSDPSQTVYAVKDNNCGLTALKFVNGADVHPTLEIAINQHFVNQVGLCSIRRRYADSGCRVLDQ